MKSLQLLKSIELQVFTTKDALRKGVSPHVLAYLTRKGILERVAHGTYIFAHSSDFALVDLILEAQTAVGECILGHNTALHLHDATDQPTDKIHLIVPYQNSSKKSLPDVQIHRTRIPLDHYDTETKDSILMTTFEQTIIDLMRGGMSLGGLLAAINRFNNSRRRIDAHRLNQLSKRFRCGAKTQLLLEALGDED